MKKTHIALVLLFLFLFCTEASAARLKIGVVGFTNSTNTRKICNALKKNGAKPVNIDEVTDSLSGLDGLVLPGGPDISPSRYGAKNLGSVGIVPALDKLQFTMLDEFLDTGKPVLGICRGLELINVYYGGTLKQNITGHRGTRHNVTNVKGMWCYDVLGKKVKTNSEHHQCVGKLGKGLIVCARKGKIVEALCHRNLPVYAVQWHPENAPKKTGNKVLSWWLDQCSQTEEEPEEDKAA